MKDSLVKVLLKIKADTGYLRAGFEDLEKRVDAVERTSKENSRWIWWAVGGGSVLYTLTTLIIGYVIKTLV